MTLCRRRKFLDDASLGRCVPWTTRPLDDVSLGRRVPWTARPLKDASLFEFGDTSFGNELTLRHTAVSIRQIVHRVQVTKIGGRVLKESMDAEKVPFQRLYFLQEFGPGISGGTKILLACEMRLPVACTTLIISLKPQMYLSYFWHMHCSVHSACYFTFVRCIRLHLLYVWIVFYVCHLGTVFIGAVSRYIFFWWY
jgi:hypothetical protein